MSDTQRTLFNILDETLAVSAIRDGDYASLFETMSRYRVGFKLYNRGDGLTLDMAGAGGRDTIEGDSVAFIRDAWLERLDWEYIRAENNGGALPYEDWPWDDKADQQQAILSSILELNRPLLLSAMRRVMDYHGMGGDVYDFARTLGKYPFKLFPEDGDNTPSQDTIKHLADELARLQMLVYHLESDLAETCDAGQVDTERGGAMSQDLIPDA